MEGVYDPKLVDMKRYQLRSGKYAYDVLYDNVVVGKIRRPPSGYGNPWIGFLFCDTAEQGAIHAGSGSEIKTVLRATVRTLSQNFSKVTIQPEKQIQTTVTETKNGPERELQESMIDTERKSPESTAPRPRTSSQTGAGNAKSTSNEATPCLCGCGDPAKPKSKFRQGHDAKAKGMISRALRSLEPDYRPNPNAAPLELPEILVERAKADADFSVAQYNAATIVDLAEKVGIR